MNLLFKYPYIPFFTVGLATLIIGGVYYFQYPDSEIDLGGTRTFSMNSAYAWLIFTAYLLALGSLYFIAARGRLRTKRWLISLHFAFVALFLFLFCTLTFFGSSFVQDHLTGLPFGTILAIYSLLFLSDVVSLIASLVITAASVLSFKGTKNSGR